VSGDGETITFSSDANVMGLNPDRNVEAFRWTGSLALLTTSGRDNFVQGVDGEGDVFPINSQANWTGTNFDGNTELFVFDLTTLPIQIEQVTDTDFPATGALEGTVDDAGDLVVFNSARDLLGGGGPSNTEVFVRRVGVGLHQLTDVGESGTGPISVPELSGDGTSVFVGSTRDFDGSNPTHASHVFRFECTIPRFSDVPLTHGFYDEIEWLASSGIGGGFPDGTFRPAIAVSRQAMAAFLYRMAGSPAFVPPATPSFTDVPTSHGFFLEIEWLADSGIGGGFPDGRFRPTLAVSRQAMGAFLYRMADSPVFVPPVTPSFSDVPTTHDFYLEIEWMADVDVAGGFPDDTFRPSIPVSRQAMAAFLFRLAPLL
jgi:hypothetical protein